MRTAQCCGWVMYTRHTRCLRCLRCMYVCWGGDLVPWTDRYIHTGTGGRLSLCMSWVEWWLFVLVAMILFLDGKKKSCFLSRARENQISSMISHRLFISSLCQGDPSMSRSHHTNPKTSPLPTRKKPLFPETVNMSSLHRLLSSIFIPPSPILVSSSVFRHRHHRHHLLRLSIVHTIEFSTLDSIKTYHMRVTRSSVPFQPSFSFFFYLSAPQKPKTVDWTTKI